MEDSGFDSGDLKMPEEDCRPLRESTELQSNSLNNGKSKTARNSAQLQKRMERHIEQARKSQVSSSGVLDQQPKKSLIAISRLQVPSKTGLILRDGAEQPLVSWEADSSEDEYEFNPHLSRSASNSITKQLQKDGFNLDLTPDDEDLDLIPPRPLHQRCVCCHLSAGTCNIQ